EMKIISDVKQYANGIINSTEVRDWAVASIAISSLGENPKNFSNINFISTLYSFFDGTQFGYKWSLDDDIFAIIALSAAGEKGKVINQSVKNLIALQNEDGGWGYGVDDESSVTFTALAIQAILASGVVKPNNESIKRAISFLKENQLPDGGFPYDERSENVSRAYPTALVISALLATNTSQNMDIIKNATAFLLSCQDEEGYFQDPVKSKIETTTYAIIALSSLFFPPLHQIPINTPLPDIYPVDIIVKPKGLEEGGFAYAGVKNEVIVKVKSNGGAFNVSLINESGLILDERRVIEKRSDAITEVRFEWKPTHEGFFNLSILADIKEEIEEANENNNLFRKNIKVKLPDLYPCLNLTNKTFYSNLSNDFLVELRGFGEKFNLSITFECNGTSDEETNDTSKTDFTKIKITNVTCYAYQTLSASWKPKLQGKYKFFIITDCDSDVREEDESNNTKEGWVDVILPDIYPYNISFSPLINTSVPSEEKGDFMLVNKSNRINVSLRGAGEDFNVSLFYTMDKEENLTLNFSDASLIGKKKVSRVLGDMNVSFLFTPKKEGLYRILAVIDADNDVYEANESNNWILKDIKAINEAPDVRLIFPRGGETFINRDFIDVKWEATDPNDDILNISISFRDAHGKTWMDIARNIKNSGIYRWYIKNIADGDYVLRVEASDGKFGDYDMTMEPFTICNKKSHEEASQFHPNAGLFLSEAPDTNEIAWNTTDIGAVEYSQPIVAEGKVFVYCDNEEGTFLVAIDENDGEIKWKKELDKRTYGSWSSPAYHNGNVFIGSGKYVYSIDAESGKVNWKTKVEKNIVNSCPVVANGKVFIGGYGAEGHPEYYCLDEATGEILWIFNETVAPEIANIINPRATSTPTFHENKIFVGFGSGIIGSSGAPSLIYCLYENGTEVWHKTTDYGIWGSITVIHGTLYFGTYNFDGDSTYYAMSPADGSEKWKRKGIRTDSTPAYAFGNLYICGGYPGESPIATYCLDPETGREIWRKENIGGWTISPVVSKDGKLIVGKTGQKGAEGVYCLDAFTGKVIWSSPYGGSTAVIANGRVYT
ncbi:MAG: outer membrane protein assembly factor BamB family protein, partial [Candidatus Methanospirareceae archaeon]